MKLYTTLKRLRDHGACKDRYAWLVAGLDGYPDDKLIDLEYILDRNGLDDALWALRACEDAGQFSRLLICLYAERVLPFFERHSHDRRPRECIETARRFAMGKATEKDTKHLIC